MNKTPSLSLCISLSLSLSARASARAHVGNVFNVQLTGTTFLRLGEKRKDFLV